MSISTPFIRRPIGTSLLMAAIFLVGLAAYPLLPVAPLPQVDFPTITVTAQYPGASPDTMASSVAEPLETQFSQINGLAQMTSMNVLGTSTVTLQFDLDRNIDAASDRRAGGDQRRAGAIAEEPAEPADHPQGQPGGCADLHPGGAVGRAAADRGGRLRREHPGAAAVEDFRRVAGIGRRAAEAGDPRADRPCQAGLRWV